MTEIELYRPSSGSEGACFMAEWCERCERDAAYQNSGGEEAGCEIAANTMAYEIDEPGYPSEWRYVDGEPVCTAFEAVKEIGR